MRDNYEQILADFLANYVDSTEDGHALVFRNNAPTLEEIENNLGNKVYCVYSVFEGDFGQQTSQPINLYSYGSQAKVFAKKELLSNDLQNGAVVISGNNIKVKFTSGTPFVQDKTDPDDNIKGYYINILATVYKY
ncbi:MAG: hypothetical protein IKW45_06680 [Clostridia bacterium]|nr:hypothetical protein [Clostridia bacterium]